MKKIIKLIIAIIFALIIQLIFNYMYDKKLLKFINLENSNILLDRHLLSIIISLGAILITYLLISPIISKILISKISKIEKILFSISLKELLFSIIGIIIGLIVANLIGIALDFLGGIGEVIIVLLNLILGYLGFKVANNKKKEINNFLEPVENLANHKILDTSVIIDGRIIDILRTGFVEGIIVIPQFILAELRHIADSSDSLKRNRGRRGLDILNEIQKQLHVPVEIIEKDYEEVNEVDSKLIKLAEEIKGTIVTNDFNLNKVAAFKGISVLNINELANAIKPVVLPGEDMTVTVIKDGKEHEQGIGYLNDGTMIVIEGGRKSIGKTIDVLVTSVLQTAAGRMIFTKIKI